jgi:hypothetical protein
VSKKISLWSLFILPVAIAGVLFLSPAIGGQESQRGQCEQACNETFKACNKAPNADRAACSAAYKECRDKCKTVDPKPTPTATETPTPTPTETVTPTPTPTPSPTPDKPESARGQCEQDCNAAFKACNTAPGANRAACASAYKECRDKCKEVEPHPSPTATPTPTPGG